VAGVSWDVAAFEHATAPPEVAPAESKAGPKPDQAAGPQTIYVGPGGTLNLHNGDNNVERAVAVGAGASFSVELIQEPETASALRDEIAQLLAYVEGHREVQATVQHEEIEALVEVGRALELHDGQRAVSELRRCGRGVLRAALDVGTNLLAAWIQQSGGLPPPI
jgi:hypothetical protein